MSTGYIKLPLSGGGPAGAVSWKASVAAISDLPASDNTVGDARVVTDNNAVFIWGDDNAWHAPAAGAAWGGITGTLSSQTDLQTALNAKAPAASPTFTGTIGTPLTASRAMVTDASGNLSVSAATDTELSYVNGVTSAIQTQLNAKLAKSGGTMTGAINVGNQNVSNIANLQGQWSSFIDLASFTAGFYCPFYNSAMIFNAGDFQINLPSGNAVRPNVTAVNDLGTTTKRWRDIYLSGKVCTPIAAATTLGTVVGKKAIYDPADGTTILGYIPIYDSIT